jgi:hypothetical protein
VFWIVNVQVVRQHQMILYVAMTPSTQLYTVFFLFITHSPLHVSVLLLDHLQVQSDLKDTTELHVQYKSHKTELIKSLVTLTLQPTISVRFEMVCDTIVKACA